MLDLSLSLNPVAPDPVPVVARHLDAVRIYPDAGGGDRGVGRRDGRRAERLLLTNGGAEAIALVAAEIGGHVDEPDFGLHPRGRRPAVAVEPPQPERPPGSTGRRRADVWDEAFFPLATGRWTRGDGDVVVGSLTKLLACPGLRLGYVLADPDLVARCRARQPEWSVGAVAAAALPDLLGAVDLPAWCARCRGAPDRAVGSADVATGFPSAAPTPIGSWSTGPACGSRWRLTASSSATAPASACPA